MHILLVAQDPESCEKVLAVLEGAGHRVEVVSTGSAALAALARPHVPELILLAERMRDMPALDFLQSCVRLAVTPPILILGENEEAARWMEAARLGAMDFVLADAQGRFLRTLPGRVEAARARHAQRDGAHRLADALASTAAAVLIANRAGGIEHMNAACARLFGVSPARAPLGGLAELLALKRGSRLGEDFFAAAEGGGEWAGEVQVKTAQGEAVPCIVTLSPIRRSTGQVDGVVITLRDVSDRVAMEEALRAANGRLAEQAAKDNLTGLYNRGYFYDVLERELARVMRYGSSLCVLMVDQDGFKSINDEFGHAAGDDAIRRVGQELQRGLREVDVLARYGGDEFCILLPQTGEEEGYAAAERLRARISQLVLALQPGSDATTSVNVSIGMATASGTARTWPRPSDLLLARADEALLAAKRAGGNRVVRWSSLSAEEARPTGVAPPPLP